MAFFGATGTPVLDFCWHLLWVSKPEWVLSYSFFVKVNVMYIPPRSTSSATRADLLVAGITVGHFPTCIKRGGTWLGFETEDERATIASDPAFRITTLVCVDVYSE